jgi:hypothetical protein
MYTFTQGSTLTVYTTCPSGKYKAKNGCPKESNVLNISKKQKYLVVRWASVHGNLQADSP